MTRTYSGYYALMAYIAILYALGVKGVNFLAGNPSYIIIFFTRENAGL